MRLLSFILVPSLCAFTATLAETAKDDDLLSRFLLPADNSNENLTVVEGWKNIEKNTKNFANATIERLLPLMMKSSGGMNLSSQCMKDVLHLISGLRDIKPWAVRFLDSSGKIPDGVQVGSFSSFGIYDECVETVVKSTSTRNKGKVLFSGQYCTINVNPPLPPKIKNYKMDVLLDEFKNFSKGDTAIAESSKNAQIFYLMKLLYGICVPSGCSVEDVDKIAKIVGNKMSLNAAVSRCEVKQENDYSPLVIAVMTCFCFPGLLMIVGTLIDLYAHYSKVIYRSKAVLILTSFSIFTNFQKFVNTQTSSDTLSCLNGIRFLCMSWIVLGHAHSNMNFQMILDMTLVNEQEENFAFQAVVNAFVAVDTFYFIGGLLVCYVTIRRVRQQEHRFSIIQYIFHRLWRILPVYSYAIMSVFLCNLIGSGPVWYDTVHNRVQDCYDNWWTNLLFINNFYDPEKMCIPQSWYIACDFQLYIGALLILLPMMRWPKVGILLGIIAIVGSVIYSGVATYINDYPPGMMHLYPEGSKNLCLYYYYRPFVHAGPYSIGILVGYLLATKSDVKIPPVFQVMGWGLAFIFNFSVLYGVVEWNRGTDPTLLGTLLYASLNRVAWSLGVAWMVVCCCTGQGGVINYILTWKVFIPLSRLTYIVYLIHPSIQIVTVGSLRTRIQMDHYFVVYFFFGHMFFSYGTAFASSMLIEAPFLALEKILLPKKETKTEMNSSLEKENSISSTGDLCEYVNKRYGSFSVTGKSTYLLPGSPEKE